MSSSRTVTSRTSSAAIAARRVGIPVVAVSRGWTWENWKVRQYERLDRLNLRYLDHVVAVSDGAGPRRFVAAGVPSERVSVIHNGSRVADFQTPDPGFDTKLHSFFPADTSVSHVVLSAGRLSPEKGFDVLDRSRGPRVLQAAVPRRDSFTSARAWNASGWKRSDPRTAD